MQSGEEIESLINELEQIVAGAKAPMMNSGNDRKIVESQQIFGILDEIRERFPDELQAARRVLAEEQEILDRARQQADSIIADAQRQAVILSGDQEVYRIAENEARKMREEADQYKRDTHYNAQAYADAVLQRLEDSVTELLNSVTSTRQTLDEQSGYQSQPNNNVGSW